MVCRCARASCVYGFSSFGLGEITYARLQTALTCCTSVYLGRDAGAAVPAGLDQLADQLDVDVEDLGPASRPSTLPSVSMLELDALQVTVTWSPAGGMNPRVAAATADKYISTVNAWHSRRQFVGLAANADLTFMRHMLKGWARTHPPPRGVFHLEPPRNLKEAK